MKLKLLPIAVLLVLMLFALNSVVSAQIGTIPVRELRGDNLENMDLWEDMTTPYTKLFPDEIADTAFFGYLLSIVLMGVFMKTRSAGAIVITLMIFGLLLSSLLDEAVAVVFRATVSVACAVILYLLYKSR